MLNRKNAPQTRMLAPKPLPAFTTAHLSNGTPVYMLQHGTVEVADVQVVYRTGSAYQDKIGQARYTASNMSEATASYSNQQFAEKLDDYGAFISADTAKEFVAVDLTSLEKHLPHTLPLLQEVLLAPAFPEQEFMNMKTRNLQKLQVESKRKTYQARRTFGHLLFGADNPYGAHLGPQELAQLQLADIKHFYQEQIQHAERFFTVVGRFDEANVLKQLDELFGSQPLSISSGQVSKAKTAAVAGGKGRHLVMEEGMQSALCVGHIGFERKHPDYNGMSFLTTLYGGFFGSRLMKNIREDKGYTYGIRSGWVSGKYSGYLIISSQVGNEYAESTIEEIRKEMQRLRVNLCTEEELNLVKNYMLGSSISQRETASQMSSWIRFSVMNDMPFEQLSKRYQQILDLNSHDVLKLASKYFKPDDLLEVVCGNPI